MLELINISYNKEYLELAQAFIPDLGRSEEKLTLERKNNIVHGKLGTFKDQLSIEPFFGQEKTDLKRLIYKFLSKYTEKDLAWGILVGVNPLKLVRRLIREHGLNKAKIILSQGYFLSEEKINLALDVIKNQEPLVEKLRAKAHVYVDIPFCPSKCHYCSYPTYLMDQDKMAAYTQGVIEELEIFFQNTNKKISTIYIGGGTPSALGRENLEKIIKKLETYIRDPEEFTVEIGRPDTINRDLLLMLKDHQVSRISINPQSMNDQTLKNIGRNHQAVDIERTYKLARDLGFDNINMDLIMGLPGEGPEDFKESLDRLRILDPASISIHSLTLKKGSELQEGAYKEAGDLAFAQVRKDFMENSAYLPYYLYRQKYIYLNLENIGFCKRGREGLYNIAMMEDLGPVLAFGLGASSKIIKDHGLKRLMNPRRLKDYLAQTQASGLKKIKIFGE
ncbi:MAG: coproporphyrinogen dehydrogenase HemZ [Bacillota bacterium]|nr:coproporphyrinogen dehydrogenase HemZ [Bacillota bacterium]